ncbi:hypothetical protein [Saccharomonospora iraqiensis]|uniref:hypothetical protein n=1 Tax=Saccharomonospora iraqiensis TaxID=52698 RepID=UPI00022DF4F9|nr:hypothetical protein [Saccharomonospora iraqiensis]
MTRPQGPLPQDLVSAIAREMAAAPVPQGWRRLRLEYRAVGRYVEVDFLVTDSGGATVPLAPPPRSVELLGRLRAGMYQPGRGTWSGAMITVDPGRTPRLDHLHDRQPRWRRQPPPAAFADELRLFPRSAEHVPEWLRHRASEGRTASSEKPPLSAVGGSAGAGADPERHGDPPMHTPRVFDGLDDAGAPVLDRAPLEPAERERVLDYLAAAPVVLAARSHDTDVLDPDRPPSVPLTFRTDGFWVWPGAVAYYLREHDVAPDPEFLTHLRARKYTVPEVDEPTRERAVAAVTAPAE